MKKHLGFLSILFLCIAFIPALAHAQDPSPEKTEDLPLVVWMTYDPWAMVIGSDAPRFALYESGFVIYWTDLGYQSVVLSEAELTDFLTEVGSFDDFFVLDEFSDLAMMTDQPSHVLHVWQEAEHHQVGVYGDLVWDKDVRADVPAIYLHLFELIAEFNHPDAELWQPEYFEIILWEYETSQAVYWQADWPDFEDERTIVHDSVTSIYLDEAQFNEFQLVTHHQNAIRLDKQTWAFTWRLTFPHEARWMNPTQFEDDFDVNAMDLE